jgi:lysophospholipase L1-like esterase
MFNIFITTLVLSVPAVLGYFAYGVYSVLVRDKRRFRHYWQQRRQEKIADNAVRLVVLGDSTMQGLGASEPLKATAGRVASLIEEETGRPVHIDNVSVTGATAHELYEVQLSQIDVVSADIIIVAVGSNDSNRSSDIDVFTRSIEGIVAKLPPEKTIMADVAMIKNREHYQPILEQVRSTRGIRRANLEQAFHSRPATSRMMARDYFHPNDYGYSIWFNAFEPEVKRLILERGL